jgi:hypothetical protein
LIATPPQARSFFSRAFLLESMYGSFYCLNKDICGRVRRTVS